MIDSKKNTSTTMTMIMNDDCELLLLQLQVLWTPGYREFLERISLGSHITIHGMLVSGGARR